jgi:hypothetical protein
MVVYHVTSTHIQTIGFNNSAQGDSYGIWDRADYCWCAPDYLSAVAFPYRGGIDLLGNCSLRRLKRLLLALYLLGNRSLRYPISYIPVVVGNRSLRYPTSYIPVVVHPCSRALMERGPSLRSPTTLATIT